MTVWLSWSAYSQYRKCPKQYDFQRVTEKEPPTRESKHNAIVGSVLQSTFEDFYNEELWRSNEETIDLLTDRAEKHFSTYMNEHYIDFNDFTSRYDSKSEPLKEIHDTLPKVIQGIKQEKLLGPYAKSELEIKTRFEQDFLYGYIDFVVRRPDGEIILLDGKSSRHREERVDENQLYFYTLLFYKKFHKMPDRVGFFYYRFGDDEDQAFDWIEIEKQKMGELRDSIKEVIHDIKKYNFPAKPDPKYCKWCQWEQMCDARQKQKKKNRMKRKFRSKKKDIEVEEGQDTIGFDAIEEE